MNRLTSLVNCLSLHSSSKVTLTTEVFSALRIPQLQLSTCSNAWKKENNGIKKHSLSKTLTCSNGLIQLSPLILQTNQNNLPIVEQIRQKWSRATFRVGRGSRSNNGTRSPNTIQGAFYCHPHKKPFKKTLSRRFPGHVDVFNRQGERDPLVAAEERYKRLDWGWYIGTRVGRFNHQWRKTNHQNWRDEQHVSLNKTSNEKLEKMFGPATKRPRFFPDDPYEKYNTKVNYWKYHWGLNKNRELIRKYGNPVYHYNRYKAHMIMQSDENIKSKMFYAPPGYLETINNNPSGVYTPDVNTTYPTIETAPHFQRKRLEEPPKKISSKKTMRRKLGRMLPKKYQELRKMEMYSKDPIPLWSPINFPTYHEK